MTSVIQCARCGQEAAPPASVPLAPKQADEILLKTCASCWTEWEGMEVMVINEYRLDFMNPAAQDVLTQQMREFLCLDGPPSE